MPQMRCHYTLINTEAPVGIKNTSSFVKYLWMRGRDYLLERRIENRKIVQINFQSVRMVKYIHIVLMLRLDFSEWYGCNLDEFWDAISGLAEMPYILRFVGWEDSALRRSQMPRCRGAEALFGYTA
jgi:RNAse (barnase) inhibitor barstar